MKKYIIPIVVILAFLSGALLNSGSKPEKELEALRKQERLIFTQQIIKKQVKIQEQDKLISEQQNKRIADSITLHAEIAKRDRIISQMKKRNENRSFNSYSDSQLDSLLSAHWRYDLLPAH